MRERGKKGTRKRYPSRKEGTREQGDKGTRGSGFRIQEVAEQIHDLKVKRDYRLKMLVPGPLGVGVWGVRRVWFLQRKTQRGGGASEVKLKGGGGLQGGRRPEGS